MVDLERRKVVDILPERSSAGTAAWLRIHPKVEIVCRDRHGPFAAGTRDGAPQAIQVAVRFPQFAESVPSNINGLDAPTDRR